MTAEKGHTSKVVLGLINGLSWHRSKTFTGEKNVTNLKKR